MFSQYVFFAEMYSGSSSTYSKSPPQPPYYFARYEKKGVNHTTTAVIEKTWYVCLHEVPHKLLDRYLTIMKSIYDWEEVITLLQKDFDNQDSSVTGY